MGKNKLARWIELGSYKNVIQADEDSEFPGKDHKIKGNWNREIFSNDNPIVLELACGKGEYTNGLAALFPGCNFIGIDIKGARLWRGAKTANEKRLVNTAFLRTRIEFINSFFGTDEIDEIWITFPDPHAGKRNSNKRLTSPWFLNIYRNFLKDRGIIHLKTDNSELYQYTLKLVTENSLEILCATDDMYALNPKINFSIPGNHFSSYEDQISNERVSSEILSIETFYESKFLEKGMKINYLAFRLKKDKQISYGWKKEK